MVKSTYPRVKELIHAEVAKLGSVNRVAIQTGLTNNTIGKYLDGYSEPQQETLERLAAYFKRPVAWLRGDTDDISCVGSQNMSHEDLELLACWENLQQQMPCVKRRATRLLAALLADDESI